MIELEKGTLFLSTSFGCMKGGKYCKMFISETGKYPKAYAVKHKNISIRMESRSGGIFTAISDYVLKNEGIVYGCALNDRHVAVHMRAMTVSERNRFRGSKYIQSDLNTSFKSIRQDLLNGNLVLFSGTPCQVSALRSYVSDLNIDKLLTVDIVCHGVPSPKVWMDYLKWVESDTNEVILSVDFRNKKKYGWHDHVETITTEKRRYDSKVYTTLFYSHNAIRPSCYKCPYKNLERPGDISIADFWGIDKAVKGFDDYRGVSLVLINNDRGKHILGLCEQDITVISCDIGKCMQPPLLGPFGQPENRNKFWQDYAKKDFEYIARTYGGYGIKSSFKLKFKPSYKLKRFVKKVIGKL